mmetsp:Transcript_10183/g.18568  ORF Transcript_10183/g.18568 Transcript_10183/m.18568 type:complete len:330 (-) Transcript_10183:196-1185(-)
MDPAANCEAEDGLLQLGPADSLGLGDDGRLDCCPDGHGELDGLDGSSFAEILGSDCVIQRVDKNQKVLGGAKPEEMQHELMSRASTQRRLSACADHVKNMSREEKLLWALDLKDKGNESYHASKFEEAARLYGDCLVALHFEGTPEENGEVASRLQLPVCTNLAACLIEMGGYERCIEICNIALTVDSKAVKAIYRRGVAHFRLGVYKSARSDFEAALAFISTAQADDGEGGDSNSQDSEPMGDLQRRVRTYLGHIQRFSEQERATCKRMFQRNQDEKHLYEDRPGANIGALEEDEPQVDDSDEAIEAALQKLQGSWRCCTRRSDKKFS